MSLSTPAQVMERLEEIDVDLAERAIEYETAALGWFLAKRDREEAYAEAFVSASGSVEERKQVAIEASVHIGAEHEARYEAHKAVVRVLETRSNIGMSLLKAHGRA